jgi:DNA polymerase IV
MAADSRSILHVDMDAFFAAIEQLDNPALRGKPIIVGHDGPRGVVSTASYEARPFGCRSAMPVAVAKRLCPQAIVVPVRGRRYREFSQRLFAILGDYSPLVEPLSIDEAFVDLTGTERLLGPAAVVAATIQQRIRTELHLTGSIGVAPNKFLAKLASDLKKPDGLTIITPDNVDAVLTPLPITRIWGIGPKTAARLEAMNLRTIGDLRRLPLEWFIDRFGEDGERFRRLCFGLDTRQVTPDDQAKSIGQEHTFGEDEIHAETLRAVLLSQVEDVAWRLRRAGLSAQGVRLKLRYGDFKTISRSVTLQAPTHSTDLLWESTLALFDAWARESLQPVRLIGMTATTLGAEGGQLDLFDQQAHERRAKIDSAVDQINAKYGKSSIHRARSRRPE